MFFQNTTTDRVLYDHSFFVSYSYVPVRRKGGGDGVVLVAPKEPDVSDDVMECTVVELLFVKLGFGTGAVSPRGVKKSCCC